jgi:hypothetical protein
MVSGPLQVLPYTVQGMHRSGWKIALAEITGITDSRGVSVDGFLEESHSWDYVKNVENGTIPYKMPWVGFLHNPANMPGWYHPFDHPQCLVAREAFQESVRQCRGIFVLSNVLAEWVRTRFDFPVSVLTHPTETPALKFTMDLFLSNTNRAVIQIGYWLRRLYSIQKLRTSCYERVWNVPRKKALAFRDEVERNHVNLDDLWRQNYRESFWVDHEEYDALLSRNIVFLDLYDASASNAIVECIVRNTPMLVNRLPAVVEYLGDAYPLYFDGLEDAATKLEDLDCIRQAHKYLRDLDKERYRGETFAREFLSSEVWQCL